MKNLFWFHGINTSEKAVKSAKVAFYIALVAGILTILYGLLVSFKNTGVFDVDVIATHCCPTQIGQKPRNPALALGFFQLLFNWTAELI